MADRRTSQRRRSLAAYALGVVLLVTGTLHVAVPGVYTPIIPEFLGSPRFWVSASGVAELACAVGLLAGRTRRAAGWACAVLFVVVFPANVQMAVDALRGDGSVLLTWARLPLQVPLVLWAVYVAGWVRPAARRRGRPRPGSAAR